MEEQYKALADAVVVQAARDYLKALRDLKLNPGYSPAQQDRIELELFFQSVWYGLLSRVDGERLLSRLRREVAA